MPTTDSPGDEDIDFGELVELAGKELERRFKSDPDSLPGTFVIKLWLDGNKALRAGDAPEAQDDSPPPDVLDLVQSPGLPSERKQALLLSERTKIVDRLASIDKALEEIDDGQS